MEHISIHPQTLRKWRRMTDCNAHGECLESIAEFFAAQDYAPGIFAGIRDALHEVNERHNAARSLSYELMQIRAALSDALMQTIKATYGPEIYAKVYATG